ncbi:MAG: hypothetical protein FWG88_02015 [Oscillospiraceae bacterium]|nr:hypothetical protein [Oscillospiraceae bacterium]
MRVNKPDIIKEILYSVKDEYGSYHNRYVRDSLVFWLMCSGVHLYNIADIRTEDVNREAKQIKVNGTEYDIIDDDIFALMDAWAQCTYIESTRYGSVFLTDSEYLFRPNVVDRLFDEKSSSGSFIAAISRISNHYFDVTGKRITMTSVGVTMPRVFTDVIEIIEIVEVEP